MIPSLILAIILMPQIAMPNTPKPLKDWAEILPIVNECSSTYIPARKSDYARAGITYDCQNYSRWMSFYLKHNGVDNVRQAIVKNDTTWGGVKATGGEHQLLELDTNDGTYILEPQSGNIISKTKYPNKILRYE